MTVHGYSSFPLEVIHTRWVDAPHTHAVVAASFLSDSGLRKAEMNGT
jgi:hypothetical protein